MRNTLFNIFYGLFMAFIGATLLMVLVNRPQQFLVELAHALQLQILMLGLLGLIVAVVYIAMQKNRLKAVLLHVPYFLVLSLAAFTTYTEAKNFPRVPMLEANTQAIPEAQMLSVVQHNVWRYAKGWEPTFELLENTGADVICLEEVFPKFKEQLKRRPEILERFHLILHPWDELMILSRWPMRVEKVHTLARRNQYVFTLQEAVIEHPAGPIRLLAVHSPHPSSPIRNVEVDMVLEAVTKEIKQSPLPTVLAGDFNLSVFSPKLQAFAEAANLQLANTALSPAGTWPSYVPALMRVGIDHVLVSPDFKMIEAAPLQPTSSDHLPIEVKLAIQNP